MNSILQCLSKEKTLQKYFCSKSYTKDSIRPIKLANGRFIYVMIVLIIQSLSISKRKFLKRIQYSVTLVAVLNLSCKRVAIFNVLA